MSEAVLHNQKLFRQKSLDGFVQPRRVFLDSSAYNTTAAQRLVASPIEAVLENELPLINSRMDKLKKTVLLSLIIVTFCGGLGIFAMTLRTNHRAIAQVAQLSQKSDTASTDGKSVQPPSEDPVTSSVISGYKVAADLPRVIRISKIKVEARVMQIGVLADGSLDTPKNTNDTAWYTGSSKPGQGGAVLIDGHASGATTNGIFYNLHKLNAGDGISVERGDGSIISYKVVKKEQVNASKVDMAVALVPVTVGKTGLNIITCSGTFDQKSQTYDQRVIVYAEQV